MPIAQPLFELGEWWKWNSEQIPTLFHILNAAFSRNYKGEVQGSKQGITVSFLHFPVFCSNSPCVGLTASMSNVLLWAVDFRDPQAAGSREKHANMLEAMMEA